MSLSHIINPAGGIRYHLRALKGRSAWRQFRRDLEAVMDKWDAKSDRLVIIGSSGGYSLCGKTLRRFKSITIVEPDPIARLIFRIRFPFVKLSCDSNDYLCSKAALANIIVRYPDEAFLFSNVLGQRSLLYPEEGEKGHLSWLKSFSKILDGRSWMSYHDKVSADAPFISISPYPASQELSPDELMDIFFGPDESISYSDHCTAPWFEKASRTYLSWDLGPHQKHVIECLVSKDCHS